MKKWRLSLLASVTLLSVRVVAAAPQVSAGPPPTATGIAQLLTGRYDNAAQVVRERRAGRIPAPQHVTITIEPTALPDWQIWRVHMDVEPAVAREAGSDTSLTAVWAIEIARNPADGGWRLVPYSLNPAIDDISVEAARFDRAQWFSLEACMLTGEFDATRIVAAVPPNEMCVAETMGLGGKRAFLPTWIRRAGDSLQAQIMYFGKPWRVDAQRVRAEPKQD